MCSVCFKVLIEDTIETVATSETLVRQLATWEFITPNHRQNAVLSAATRSMILMSRPRDLEIFHVD